MCLRNDSMKDKSKKLLHALQASYDRRKIRKNGEIWEPERVNQAVRDKFDEIDIQWEDGKYIVCDVDIIEYVLEHSIVDDLKYTTEFFDCDNFAGLFKDLTAIRYHLNTIGTVVNYAGRHAFNVALTKQGLYVVEPQNDRDYWEYSRKETEKRYQIEKQILRI